MKIVSFLMLLLILPAGFVSAQDILSFEPNDTLEEIRYKIDHNGYSFEVSDNWVFSMSPEEKSRFFSRRAPAFPRTLADGAGIGPLGSRLETVELPVAFDWRNYDGHTYIGDVRDQGDCGSCYAFGATAAAEGTYNWATGKYDETRADFSEAFLAFCLSDHYSSHFSGCDGADYDYYELTALVDYGICTETQYPYTDIEQSCPLSPYPPLTGFQSWHRVSCGDIDAIKTAIMTYGVVDAAVMANSAFQGYSSGFYEDTNTECDGDPCYDTTTNHAISLVGWDDNSEWNGQTASVWILRNSWGTSWGESGYMRIRYTSAAVSCAVCYLVYEPPTSPTPTPVGYRTPTPTPSTTPTPEGFHTPPPSPTPSATPSPAPYSIPFSENFEGVWAGGAPEGWMKEYIMGTNDWTQADGGYNGHPASAHGGSYNAHFFYEGWSDIVTRLISPRLEFGPYIYNARLTFWLAMEEWLEDQDELSVYYRTSAGGEWNLLTHYDASITAWTEQGIDLPEPGDDYYVCFQGTANYGYGVCVDDILITGDAFSPTPTPLATPTATATPTLTPFAPPPATPTPTPIPPTPTPAGPTPIATPTPLTTRTPSPTPTCGPTVRPPHFIVDSGDYNGDGTSDIAIFRSSSGLWAVRGITRVYFGRDFDQTASGDYDGDGGADIAIFRQNVGLWAIRGVSRIYYGTAGDRSSPADYNGDGITDVTIFRAGIGLWAVRGVTRAYYGTGGDSPIPGDYDGSGTSAIGIFRPLTGLWALRNISRIYFGSARDWTLPADYDGNGLFDVAIFRPSSGLWAIRGLTRAYFGCCLDYPLRADFDGNGTADITIFRQDYGLWAVRDVTRSYFGTTGDTPVTR